MLEKIQKVYESVKTKAQEGIEKFRKKFEGTKIEMSQEVLNAKSPEDLIMLGKKLQEQGEALKAEEMETQEDSEYQEGEVTTQKEQDEEAFFQDAEERSRKLEEDSVKDKEDSAAKAEEILKKINGDGAKLEIKARSTEDRLESLQAAFKDMPELKPKEDDLDKFNQYLNGIKTAKGGEATGRYNQLMHTYEYVRRVAEDPKFAEEIKKVLIEQLKAKGVGGLAETYEMDSEKLDDEAVVEKAKLEYVSGNGGKMPGGHFDGYVRRYHDLMGGQAETGGQREESQKEVSEHVAVKKSDKKEPSAEDIESAKKIFGKALRGPETSEQFGGSQIFLFEGPDGKKKYYALRRNSGGQLEGNEFSLMEKEDGQWKNFVSTGLHRLDQHDPNVSVGPTYQMHGPKLKMMEALLRSQKIEI